jgi:hypothetical protein
MNPLTSVKGSIVTALVLAAIVSVLLTVGAGADISLHHPQLGRWLHIVSGVMWIGLLYYFNVVQVPGLADAAADKGGTSRRARSCGSAGRPSPRGSPAPGISAADTAR